MKAIDKFKQAADKINYDVPPWQGTIISWEINKGGYTFQLAENEDGNKHCVNQFEGEYGIDSMTAAAALRMIKSL